MNEIKGPAKFRPLRSLRNCLREEKTIREITLEEGLGILNNLNQANLIGHEVKVSATRLDVHGKKISGRMIHGEAASRLRSYFNCLVVEGELTVYTDKEDKRVYMDFEASGCANYRATVIYRERIKPRGRGRR